MHAEGLAYFDLERTWVRAPTIELYTQCLHIVHAGTSAFMTGMNMTALTESSSCCNTLQYMKKYKNERETSQWRLLALYFSLEISLQPLLFPN